MYYFILLEDSVNLKVLSYLILLILYSSKQKKPLIYKGFDKFEILRFQGMETVGVETIV